MKRPFFTLLVVIVVMVTVIVSLKIYKVNHEPEVILAQDEMNAACCTEERMISIYEGTESLEASYDTVQFYIYHRDSINTNAVTIKKMWEDSLKANRLRALYAVPPIRK